jgi:hypothetical protein
MRSNLVPPGRWGHPSGESGSEKAGPHRTVEYKVEVEVRGTSYWTAQDYHVPSRVSLYGVPTPLNSNKYSTVLCSMCCRSCRSCRCCTLYVLSSTSFPSTPPVHIPAIRSCTLHRSTGVKLPRIRRVCTLPMEPWTPFPSEPCPPRGSPNSNNQDSGPADIVIVASLRTEGSSHFTSHTCGLLRRASRLRARCLVQRNLLTNKGEKERQHQDSRRNPPPLVAMLLWLPPAGSRGERRIYWLCFPPSTFSMKGRRSSGWIISSPHFRMMRVRTGLSSEAA